ncbi:threo-3-hydroxy-L-aspartate ammonia-lyase [Demetria terragena]|uniref:threo-3-hydroxy-L-aspartate ammonia-lyase n=1 Tax=Demetria terragena TaxID=63959 RepID=UPI000370A89B|nr:threo-3-hydroxy-L-aspartate ammonia-lyase [Demetria terragena]
MNLPTPDDVAAAADRIRGVAHRTPVMTSTRLNELLGVEVFLKCENFQRMGAFKFRGAYNALSQFDQTQRESGVVAFSSGNHAQAIALSARILGIRATIVMPTDAPVIKRQATEGYGARVVTYDRAAEDREAIGLALAENEGATLIPPFNHPDIVAGQGTAALELFQDVADLDSVLAPMGGGGLVTGTCLAAQSAAPVTQVFGVEPAAGDDAKRSLDAGRIIQIPTPSTIADGAQTQAMGEVTFALAKQYIAGIETATDDELVTQMAYLASTLKIMVEPTGCLGLAALARKPEAYGKRIGIILSGGNVDMARFVELVGQTA